jgi:TonB family protein
MNATFALQQTAAVTVIFALAAVATWMLRRQSAASRYYIWFLASVGALTVPLASLIKPVVAPAVLLRAPVQSTFSITVRPDSFVWPWLTATHTIVAAWTVGFLLLFSRLLLGIVHTSRNRRSSAPSGISAEVDVRLSDRIAVPETFGFLRPVILLPVEASDWSADRLNVVIAHELVHVKRSDWLTQLLAQFSTCVYWFHPLAWLALSRIRKERELACDDGVLQQGYRNSEYAQHLVDIARGVRSQTEALAPSIPMATRSHLEDRVRAILNPALKRGTVTTMMKIAAPVITAVAILLFSSGQNFAAGAVTVSGTIADASGALVPKAQIILTPKGRGKSYATSSGEAGSWELRFVQPGLYNVDIRRAGFAAHQEQIQVPEDRPLQVDVRLSVGKIEESVTVQGQGIPVVQGRISGTPVAAGPSRLRVGGDVQAAKLLKKVMPEYPIQMKQAGISGAVVLQAVISKEGDVISLENIAQDVHPDLVEAALTAVKQWQYQPTLLNGNPVEILTLINVNFTLAP